MVEQIEKRETATIAKILDNDTIIIMQPHYGQTTDTRSRGHSTAQQEVKLIELGLTLSYVEYVVSLAYMQRDCLLRKPAQRGEISLSTTIEETQKTSTAAVRYSTFINKHN